MSDYLLKDSVSKEAFGQWVRNGLETYAAGAANVWNDEDTLCEHFLGSISGVLNTSTGQLRIDRYKTRGRGPGAPEKKLGADIICLVNIQTSSASLNGFCLIQAKKARLLTDTLHKVSLDAGVMLSQTAASYIMVLMPEQVTMSGAMAVYSSKKNDPPLTEFPYASFPRYVVEQLLNGLMLEPLASHRRVLTPELKAEVKHILMIVGASDEAAAQARSLAERQLAELGFDIDFNASGKSPGDV
jgi:hypothetical protein